MAEFVISCLRIKGCRKPDQLEEKMIKELRRVAGVNKNKNIKCKVYNDKVEFKGKKDVIKLQNIERLQRNKDYGVITVVTKTRKKHSKIFAMRFLDNSEFLRFYDTISPTPTSVVVSQNMEQSAIPKQIYPTNFAQYPTPVSPHSESPTSVDKAQSSRKLNRYSNSIEGVVVEEGSTITQSSCSTRLLTPTLLRQRNQTKSEIRQVESELPARVPSYNTPSQATRGRPVSQGRESSNIEESFWF